MVSDFTFALAVFVYPLLITIFLFRYIAISSFSSRGNDPDFWLSSFGWRIANGRSIPFTLIFVSSIVFALFATLLPSLSAIVTLTSGVRTAGYIAPSALLPSFILVPLILGAVLYFTMTDGGLSWWDASLIVFRFNSFRGRRDIMEVAVEELLERDEESMDSPHRAYLTLVRLFRHKYDAGTAAREIIHDSSPEMFNETDSELVSLKSHRATQRVLLFIAILFYAAFLFFAATLNIAFFTAPFASIVTSPSMAFFELSDFFLMAFLVTVLLGIATVALEFPSLQPSEYLKLREQS